MTLRPGDPAVAVWRGYLRFERAAALSLEADLQRERGMSLDDYDVLYQLNVADAPMRMSDLAAAALIARSSCTRVVDRLVGRAWVERGTADADRRSVVVALTGEGRATLRRAAVTHLRGIDTVFARRLGRDDIAALAGILDRLER